MCQHNTKSPSAVFGKQHSYLVHMVPQMGGDYLTGSGEGKVGKNLCKS